MYSGFQQKSPEYLCSSMQTPEIFSQFSNTYNRTLIIFLVSITLKVAKYRFRNRSHSTAVHHVSQSFVSAMPCLTVFIPVSTFSFSFPYVNSITSLKFMYGSKFLLSMFSPYLLPPVCGYVNLKV